MINFSKNTSHMRSIRIPYYHFPPGVKLLADGRSSYRQRGITIKIPYDLNVSPKQKFDDCDPAVQWTAFINQAGTVCHVVCPELMMTVRLKFEKSVSEMSSGDIGLVVLDKICRGIKL